MASSHYDVVVVGAGSAGLTAAIGLARAGFAVAVVEAAVFPGAENWSGCVYFCENLAEPDLLGPEGVEELAWERRVVERGFFASDGHSLLGMSYRDPKAFQHCYTVLRPIFDHHMAQVAMRHGVLVLAETTAESLIREGNRVVGISTNRGPLYADLVFLAEGDASHLVTREGYERFTDQREAPKFLQGIKQVIEMPAGAIEEIFGVGAEEGAAYEMLLRNGTLRGRSVRLNMGGFVYTNRQSLSIGLVLPADNLKEHFAGDPNLLMEWFENLEVLKPWLRDGRRGAFGAKIIRGGGAKDIPRLIDDGLAIGGAASAIGIDFPYPNFTGPATGMGLLLARAAVRIRQDGGRFTQEALRKHYLEPLEKTHYWEDVEFLRRWPSYVKRTSFFFGRNLDLLLGSAYVWSRPDRWLCTKWVNWVRLLVQAATPAKWQEMRADNRHLMRALRLREVAGRPGWRRFLLDGTVNALRDIFGRPRANLPAAGDVKIHYRVAGEEDKGVKLPGIARRWFRRITPVLASAARRVYANDQEPLAYKLNAAIRLLVRQVNMLDLFGAMLIGAAALFTGVWSVCWDRLLRLFRLRAPGRQQRGLYPRYTEAARKATDLTPRLAAAAQHWEDRLGQLAYQSVKTSHIHLLWPRSLAEKDAVTKQGLWHVCPAHVYEARVNAGGQLQVVVNFENCIKCETCWRTSDLVDWGRDGQHRFLYPVRSPVTDKLLQAVHGSGLARPKPPAALDHWAAACRELVEQFRSSRLGAINGQNAAEFLEVNSLLAKLEQKLGEFNAALGEEPRTVDRARAEYLEMLARYAQQLAGRILEILRCSALGDSPHEPVTAVHGKLLELAAALSTKADERSRRTWDQRYSWAAADGRQLLQHHTVGMRRLLAILGTRIQVQKNPADPAQAWLRAERDAQAIAAQQADIAARLDAVFTPLAWRDLERQTALTSEQDAVLRDLLAHVPAIEGGNLAGTLHPPYRKALLAELGRRDPSLAYRAAVHLWTRDLSQVGASASFLHRATERWQRGDEWACFAAIDAVQTPNGGWQGEALFVPTAGARTLLLLVGDQLTTLPLQQPYPGLEIEKLATLGLRGAGLSRVRLTGMHLPEDRISVDRDRIRRAWSVLSGADLISIAYGMADQLCRRAIGHATGRVQFPGLFFDDQARDAIGKFGAVKKMVADMAARRLLFETLDHVLGPVDFSSASVEQTSVLKAVVAEALGTAPGSLAYNAGQIFGGTGFSEDDILAKFFRDAAAWRFLGQASSDIWHRHGRELLRGWRADGQRLAAFPQEADIFDQLVQRQALQAELDEIRVARSRLRGLVNEWLVPEGAADGVREEHQSAPTRFTGNARLLAEAREGLARQDGFLLASKALLLRTHARLEQGLPSEMEVSLLQVWLDGAAASLEEFEATLRRQFHLANQRDDRPVAEPSSGPPLLIYRDYLAVPCPYDSGDFLSRPVDLLEPRLVPEMIESDPALAARDSELRELLSRYFGQPRPDGLSYERHIERQHHPSVSDLEFCRRHQFFSMPIPDKLGGAGRSKLEYYLLTTNAQRLADVAISLTIQANTSIGTTPVLLAWEKELGKAQKDLSPLVGEGPIKAQIREELQSLRKLLDGGSPARIEEAFKELDRLLEEALFRSPVLKVLAFGLWEAWQKARQAGLAFDLDGLRQHVDESIRQWEEAGPRGPELASELNRRREASELFLRWVASGQISAFALTEPSAGSDTARQATRALLRSVPVESERDGVLRFVPEGSKETRYLLDARRLHFQRVTDEFGLTFKAFYRWADQAEPAVIHFEDYDYETDDPRQRWYDHGGRRVHFSDIAQLRERDGRYWYDYWELTGAKMWITNGRMAGIMSLYAKTREGITGFIVDRHAEGLVVGKDEDKLGQCGSPTNELSLQAVRVPRENVIGVEGRGQVNALETLNVGRAGLAMSAMTQMQGLIEQSRAFALATHGSLPDWVAWRLERMDEERFLSEALAHEVIGRFEHPQTRSVRMESAIAKMLVSESLQRVIELAEEIHGLAGQTHAHLVEKRKRDARVLNIYEGTNEVQRFGILKDLCGLGRGKGKPERKPHHAGREAVDLESLRAGLVLRIETAVGVFGQELWQNPSLQPSCFPLAEAAAWFKAADSSLGRLAWLSRRDAAAETQKENGPDGAVLTAQLQPALDLGRRAFYRCCSEVRGRLQRFDEELTHLRRGYYAPEIRAASLLFDQAKHTVAAPPPASRITRPLSVLVILEPSAASSPHPCVQRGRLKEAWWTLTDADQAALETALRLRDQGGAYVQVHVAAVGPKGIAALLRLAICRGAESARLLLSDTETITADCAAAALASALRTGPKFDLILGTGSSGSGEEGTLTRLTAEALNIRHAGSAARVSVQATPEEAEVYLVSADGSQSAVRTLPRAVGLEAGLALRSYSVADYLGSLARQVDLERWPKRVLPRTSVWVEGSAPKEAPGEAAAGPLDPEEAARQVLTETGLAVSAAGPSLPFAGPITDLPAAPTLAGGVLAVLAADAAGQLQPTAGAILRAARMLGDLEGCEVTILVLAPIADDRQRLALAQVRALFRGPVLLLATTQLDSPLEVRCRFIQECWPRTATPLNAVIGEAWTETLLAGLAIQQGSGAILPRIRRLAAQGDHILLESSRDAGKILVQQRFSPDFRVTSWITLLADAEVTEDLLAGTSKLRPFKAGSLQEGSVGRWTPHLERFFAQAEIQQLLTEVKAAAGIVRLADAQFIIDVGFGVANRDGYEEVIEPLEEALRDIGVRDLMIGGSRKVTEELHLLPADRQIGQSGTSVQPRVLLAIGISGAPQHLNYIGPRTVILAFNRDPEAPLLTLNRRQARPRVFPVVGDLFETVPAFIAALRQHRHLEHSTAAEESEAMR